jgi:hypothetical protein
VESADDVGRGGQPCHAPEVDLFPGWIRVPTKLMGKSKTGARKARILRYVLTSLESTVR